MPRSSLGLAAAQLAGNCSHFQGQSLSLQELSDFHCVLELPGIFDKLQAHLRDSAGSVPDDCNKVNIIIKDVTRIFCFPSISKSYIYTTLSSIKCTIV